MNTKQTYVSGKRRLIRKLLLLHCLLVCGVMHAQTDTTFRIQSLQVALLPESNTLNQNTPKRFVVKGLQGYSIDSIYFSKGKASKRDSSITLTAMQGTQAFLKLFVRERNGTRKMVFSRQFNVLGSFEPKPNLDGVENDSAEHRMRMAVLGYLRLPTVPGANNKMGPSYPIISFEAELSGGRQVDTTLIQGNRLTLAFRNKIDQLTGGNLIQFRNIRYLATPEDTLTIKHPFRVYIVNDSIQKIGF